MAPKRAKTTPTPPAKKAKAGSGPVIDLTAGDTPSPPSAKKASKSEAKDKKGAAGAEVGAGGAKASEPKTAAELFAALCDPEDPELIGGEGVLKLCELVGALLAIWLCQFHASAPDCAASPLPAFDTHSLATFSLSLSLSSTGIDPQDPSALMLMWRLGAGSKPGSVTKTEFLQGMTKIRKNSLAELRAYMPFLDSGFLTYEEFRDFFRFVHVFSREGTKKTLEKDMVKELLPVVLDNARAPHLKSFLEFLDAPASAEFTHISPDAWDSFYVFNKAVHPSLIDFDADSSWPTILDTYVEWKKAQASAPKA